MAIYDPTWRVDKVSKSEIDGFTMTNIYYSTPMLEYNMFMTIFSNFKDIINSVAKDYGLNWEIDVIPEFPKDLTKIHFPSVCIREVSVNKSALVTGNPIEIEDDENGVILDSVTRKQKMLIQYDAVANTNGQRLQLKSLVDETIARMSTMTLINFNNKVHKNLPTVFNETIHSDGDAYSENITVDTLQYVGITRQGYYCNEIIIPRDNNEIIDMYNLYLVHTAYYDEDKDSSTTRQNVFIFKPIE